MSEQREEMSDLNVSKPDISSEPQVEIPEEKQEAEQEAEQVVERPPSRLDRLQAIIWKEVQGPFYQVLIDSLIVRFVLQPRSIKSVEYAVPPSIPAGSAILAILPLALGAASVPTRLLSRKIKEWPAIIAINLIWTSPFLTLGNTLGFLVSLLDTFRCGRSMPSINSLRGGLHWFLVKQVNPGKEPLRLKMVLGVIFRLVLLATGCIYFETANLLRVDDSAAFWTQIFGWFYIARIALEEIMLWTLLILQITGSEPEPSAWFLEYKNHKPTVSKKPCHCNKWRYNADAQEHGVSTGAPEKDDEDEIKRQQQLQLEKLQTAPLAVREGVLRASDFVLGRFKVHQIMSFVVIWLLLIRGLYELMYQFPIWYSPWVSLGVILLSAFILRIVSLRLSAKQAGSAATESKEETKAKDLVGPIQLLFCLPFSIAIGYLPPLIAPFLRASTIDRYIITNIVFITNDLAEPLYVGFIASVAIYFLCKIAIISSAWSLWGILRHFSEVYWPNAVIGAMRRMEMVSCDQSATCRAKLREVVEMLSIIPSTIFFASLYFRFLYGWLNPRWED